MSGPIRKLLGPAKARIQGYIKNAGILLAAPIDKDLEKEETALEDLAQRLESNVALLERCNDEWTALLKELKGDSKRGDSKTIVETEEKEYSWAAEGDDGFIELLLDSRETIARLHVRVKKVLRLQERALTERRSLGNTDDQPQANPRIKLPKLNLPTFDGNLLYWQEFWDIFDSAVNQQNISNVSKFSYLKNSLRGAAASAVCGISVTNDNYLTVIEILKEKFGNRQAIVEALYSQLQYLPIAMNRFVEIKGTYEAIEKILRQLESQKEDVAHQRIIIQQILSKFPTDVIVKLEESKKLNEYWTVDLLRESLKHYITVHTNAQRYEVTSGPYSVKNKVLTPQNKQLSAEMLVTNSQVKVKGQSIRGEPSRPCVFCNGPHFNDNCDKYCTISERKSQLTTQGRCFICLRVGHLCKECPSAKSRSCYYCNSTGHHHRSICPKQLGRTVSGTNDRTSVNLSSQSGSLQANISQASVTSCEVDQGKQSTAPTENVTLSHTLMAHGEKVILQTAKVIVSGNDGTKFTANLLLDSASQRTFMTENFARHLKLPSDNRELLLVSTFGDKKPQYLDTYVVQFTVFSKDSLPIVLYGNVLPRITGPIERGPLLQADVEFLNSLNPGKLADSIPSTGNTTTVDILVGSDYFWDIVEGGRITLPSGLLLLASKFGYILTGKYLDCATECGNSSNQVASTCLTTLRRISPCLNDLWDLDKIGICDSPYVKDDDKALELFNSTICYENGRYYITWPWKSSEVNLPENFDVAFGRMRSLSRRLQNDRTLLGQYNDIIQSQVSGGIVEKVNDEMKGVNKKHYLPHHPVVTPSKASTKVRIVYDASVKAAKGVNSLNECMYKGPITLPDMCGVLLRFRTYYLALLADIEKAFLQIGIQEKDRDVTRFLWFEDSNKPHKVEGNLSVYRFCRVPFGIVCSPFLLEATLRHHLTKEGSSVARMIRDNIYVDNVSIGASSVAEARNIYIESKQIFGRASMNLRQWFSNSNDFMNSLPHGERATGWIFKVFGLLWNRLDDYLQVCGSRIDKRIHTTKRQVVSEVSKIYDPLGLVSPVVFYGKRFLQKLWFFEMEWDDCLPSSLCEEWEELIQIFQPLPQLRIPRFVGSNDEGTIFQIVTFCDASANSYAAAVYLRVVNQKSIQVNLLFSKMRLAPCGSRKKKPHLRQLSLPRLELLAVVIGTRVTMFVAKELKVCISKKMIFTDSQCVLHWLKSTKPLPSFVQNRVNEIHQEKYDKLGYVPSEENPADFATRGLTVPQIKELNLWWHGPTWLQFAESDWPIRNLPDITSEELEKMATQVQVGSDIIYETTNVVKEQISQASLSVCTIDEEKYSSLRKLLRVTLFCLKFIRKGCWNRCSETLKAKILKKHPIVRAVDKLEDVGICSNDIKYSKLIWTYVIQQRKFSDVSQDIQRKLKNGLQKQLGLKLDEFGIMRCYGRFLNAEMSEGAKYPMLLPRREHYVNLVIQEVHERLIHAGVSHTLSSLRQEYWIPQGRRAVRACLSHCLICRRHEGPSFSLPMMPPWPRLRVSRSLPFQFTGLDYLGPIYVKEGKEVVKMWICLFTCLAVRAVHLEWVRSLSAEHFLFCLRRFMARRGRPELIISDNAAQFKLVKSVVDEQWKQLSIDENLKCYLSDNGIKWQFTTALAPWQGGFYERLVGLVKRCLRKGIGKKRLTLDQFIVMLTEVEAVINTRPLTYVYEDFQSGFTLTPAHFLTENLRPMVILDSEIEYTPTEDSITTLMNNWKRGQKQLNMFWEIWKTEYLTSLRETSPHHKSVRRQIAGTPRVGEVVIVKEDNVPRGMWKVGRIEELVKGSDGNIRTVRIYLPNGKSYYRTINHIFPLEIPDQTNDSEDKSDKDSELHVEPQDQHAGRACEESKKLPIRQAAIAARQRINHLLENNALTILFIIV